MRSLRRAFHRSYGQRLRQQDARVVRRSGPDALYVARFATGAAIAAENGATADELMAILGWLTLKEAERYTRAAEQKKIAGRAMVVLERGRKGRESDHRF